MQPAFKSFFESSHADFLEAGGARVVPIDFNLDSEALEMELASINGVYIPGDTKQSYEDEQYLTAIRRILAWAGEHNQKEDSHFPIVAVSWGMLAMLRTQTTQLSLFRGLKDHLVGEALQQNLHLLPKETFIYDEIIGFEFEQTLDEISFYHEMDEGITLDDFKKAQQLLHFVPIATYDQADRDQLEEIVSMVEGTYYPFFGFSYRLDKIQFGFHTSAGEGHEKVDHSRASIEHAQHIANLIVDEARLSGNRYEFTKDETAKLLRNWDVQLLTLPTPHEFTEKKDYSGEYRTEIYLF